MSGSKRTFSGGKPQASEYYKILHPETPASDILQMAIDKAIGPLAPVYLAQDQEDAMIHMMEHLDSPKQYELLTDSQLPILSPGTLQEITTEEYRHSDENSDETDYSSDNEDEESVDNSVASIQAVTDSSSETDEEDKIEHTKCQIRAEAEAIERAHTESKKRTEAYASNKTEDTPSTYQVPTGLKFHKRGNATNSPIKTQKVLPVLSPRKLNFNRKNKPSHRPVVKMVNHIKNNVDATAPPPVNSTISGAHQSSQVVKQEPCSSSSVPAGKKDEGGRKKMEPSQTKKMDQSRVKKATENPPVKKQKLSVLKPEEEKPSAQETMANHFMSQADNSVTALNEFCWNQRVYGPTFHENNGIVTVQLGNMSAVGSGTDGKHQASANLLAYLQDECQRLGTAGLLQQLGLTPQTGWLCKNAMGHIFELQAQNVLKDVKFELVTLDNGDRKATFTCKKKSNNMWIEITVFGHGPNAKTAKLEAALKFLKLFQ